LAAEFHTLLIVDSFPVRREAPKFLLPAAVHPSLHEIQFNLFMRLAFLADVPSLQRRRPRIAT
jgi:hypothetical protein